MDTSPRPSAARLACRPLRSERFLLTGVRLFDPEHGVDLEGDLLVEEGKIAALGDKVARPPGVDVLDDLAGCWVFQDSWTHMSTYARRATSTKRIWSPGLWRPPRAGT